MDIFYQGESIGREITLYESGSAIDTDIMLTISVAIRHKRTAVVEATYTLAAGTITKVTPTSSGKIFFDIPPATSADMPGGEYEHFTTITRTDTDYDDNTKTQIVVGDCFELKE